MEPVVARKPFYRQKKWWAFVVGVVVPVANQFLRLELDPEVVLGIVIVAVGYIIGEAWTDATH